MKKYGRTFHLPMSPGPTNDDKIMADMAALEQTGDIVVTEKMDGENTTIHAAGCHARSPDSSAHASRDWIKAFAAPISPYLDLDERIVGEYLFARHSISYTDLPSYFMGFAWIKDGEFQAWDDTLERFQSLAIAPVPVLYRGAFSKPVLSNLITQLDPKTQEGLVVRPAAAFTETDMPRLVGKYVRPNHVASSTHWMHAEITRNGLA